ncbi:hypothetical protein [Wenzhouxiangella marina]|uniref:Uncharacterized protein n=1 Tax=Wenzhouxiangella marina TaxID=1579979 RepID=A0A0K0XUZ3_9GAMM|nr:hypothetical protein [Wenzhouxiangella marina]AKS41529.1 hypothetical protein WM2015_1155 [Wenzhouxiangella marina]MBB6086712.1 hypothetical protein [Wenzhouxiangella marina]
MRWKLGVVCGMLMSVAFAQNDTGGGTSFTDAEVERLAALAPAERRAELQAMDPAQRRGLWFAVMSEVRANRNAQQLVPGSYRAATPEGAAPAERTAAAGRGVAQSGLIQYDSGPTTITFGGGAIIGNRFDTVAGRAIDSATLTAIQAVVVPGPANTTSSAGFVLLGPQTGGGGAMALFSSFTLASGATDTLDFVGLNNPTGGSFYVLFGDFASVYVPAFGPGTTMGQGRHGVVGYTGGMGPNITSTFDFGGQFNSLVRASGTILPVELLPNPE